MTDQAPQNIELERVHADLDHLRAKTRAALAIAEKSEIETEIHRLNLEDARASAAAHRVYSFTDPVIPDTVVACQRTLDAWRRRDGDKPMRVVLNSPGGSVFDGLALYDTIRSLIADGVVVDVHGQGQVFSMSAVILQAGSTRSMSPNSFLMVHEVSSAAQGKSSHMRDEAAFLEKVQDVLVSILARRSNRKPEQIAQLWDRKDWWMSAQDALEAGFIDEISS